MRGITFLVIGIILLIGCHHQSESVDKSLRISKNGRYIEDKDGKPFLYLGCTAWELFHKLNREEATEYLENRKEKGFTVIQAVVLAELNGLKTPNPYGEVPLIDLDPTKPNEKYFEHVDFIVDKAEELGLFVGMLPTWGDKVPNISGGDGPVVFTPENARVYGEYLGKRYKDKPIIWILGGDRTVDSDTAFVIWKNMAEGLKTGDQGKHLISFHPRGVHSSSYWFHNEDWIDFHMYQTAHFHRFQKVYEHAMYDYNLLPIKPTVESEPAYEDIGMEFWAFTEWRNPEVYAEVFDADNLVKNKDLLKNEFFTDYDVRVHAYWDLLSGACGYTYGNNAIWQMFKKGDKVVIPCLYDWRESLDRPGADQMRHVKALLLSRDFSKMQPDQSVIYGINLRDDNHIRSSVAQDGSFLLAYMAQGQPVRITMSKISGTKVNAWWFNPRDGKTSLIGEFENAGFEMFTPPSNGIDNDWVLVLDDASKFEKAPGV
jgi:hypothetical protein